MTLTEWVRASKLEGISVAGNVEVEGIASDTRKLKPGDIFVCMPSASQDTHDLIVHARGLGASGVVVRAQGVFEALASEGYPAMLVERAGANFNEAVGELCRAYYGDQTATMKVVGITGTNGKTTTAWMVRDALAAMGRRAAYCGTLGVNLGSGCRTLENTTPFPIEIHQLLCEANQAGMQDFVMEASSHGLQEHRLAGVRFDVGTFTNLSQDHLDYHGSMTAYAAAKLELFTSIATVSGKDFHAAINVDDPVGERWAAQLSIPIVRFGLSSGELKGSASIIEVDHIAMSLSWQGESAEFKAGVGGLFNVNNLLSAAATLMALGYPLDGVAHSLSQVTPVPGRFEPVPNALGIGIIVDYAHTPDALVKLLDSVRELQPHRVITVMGCGGDRDRAKRPLMAAAVTARSDVTVITSDNPRTEDPAAIIAGIEGGIVRGAETVSIQDRRKAIAYAVGAAKEGDIVVIAGKGHEDYQIIGRTKQHMDDREMAREALEVLA